MIVTQADPDLYSNGLIYLELSEMHLLRPECEPGDSSVTQALCLLSLMNMLISQLNSFLLIKLS